MTLEELTLLWERAALRNIRYAAQQAANKKADREFFNGCEWSPQQIATTQQPRS